MDVIDRKAAKQAGLTRYFTGQPCKHGHIAERFVSTRYCVECGKLHSKAWRHENPEAAREIEQRRDVKHKDRRRAKNLAWSRANPEKCRAWASAWQQANPDRKKAAFRAWRLANIEKVRADLKAWRAANLDHVRETGLYHRNLRRAALLNRTPVWSDLKAIEQIYQDAREFREAGLEVDVDHIIPLQGEVVSGLHVPANLRVCLSSVNRSKSNSFHI